MQEAKRKSSVDVTKPSTRRAHNVPNRDVPPQAIARDHRSQLWKVSIFTTMHISWEDCHIH